jgi:biopolymer transport protein ExbD
MTWQVRHQGSPRSVSRLSLQDIADGLRDGAWEPTDEVKGQDEEAWTPLESHPQFADIAAEVEPAPPRRHDEATSIDMNALIDVCLVLLIFFILTTAYAAAVQKVVPIATVKADGKKVRVVKLQDVKKRMIRMQAAQDRDGKLTVRVENQPVSILADDGRTIDPERVRAVLRPHIRGEDGKTEVIFDADPDLPWGIVIALQDAAKSAGIRTIHHLVRK